MKRTLIFTLRVPADITAGENETQEKADSDTAAIILPSLQRAVHRQSLGTVAYEGSE